MHKLGPLIGATLLCCIAGAQQPKHSAGHPSAVSHYSSAPFTDQVAPHYPGNDARAIFQVLATRLATGKDEFETSDQYSKKRESMRDLPIVGSINEHSRLAFVIPSAPGNHLELTAESDIIATYVADKQRMFVHILTDKVSQAGQGDNPSALGFIWGGDEPSFGLYKGSNAYGASTRVEKKVSTIYGVAFDINYGDWTHYSRRFSGTGDGIEVSFEVDPREAKELKPRLRAMVICKLRTEPLLTSYVHQNPTIQSPYDFATTFRFLHVTPLEVWVFDDLTGKVLVKSSEVFAELPQEANN
jgi:hypothetical protein